MPFRSILRRSEIDGYFERSHLCPRDVARLCGNQFIWNSGRKFSQTTGRHSCTIPIKVVGRLFGRATSLGDRRLLWNSDRKFGQTISGHFCTIHIKGLDDCSVGLRRSEIDGYFSDRKFSQTIGRHFLCDPYHSGWLPFRSSLCRSEIDGDFKQGERCRCWQRARAIRSAAMLHTNSVGH